MFCLSVTLCAQAEALEGKACSLQAHLSTVSEQTERFKAVEADLRSEAQRLSQTEHSLRVELDLERITFAETSREWEDQCQLGQRQVERLSSLLDEEKAQRDKDVQHVESLLQNEKRLREEEGLKWARIVEEERRAGLAETAMGEAVLREVQETQGLLDEVRTSIRIVRSVQRRTGGVVLTLGS